MADELLSYYERELDFLRRRGAEFAKEHPKVAQRLGVGDHETPDPHVDRLIQACAFLTARIRHKIDDEFPEITEALLNVLYPHYLAPIPSMAVIQFAMDPAQGKLTARHQIDKGTTLYTDPVNGAPCRFKTCYPVTLWPLEVTGAVIETPRGKSVPAGAAAALRISMRCTGGTKLQGLGLDSLRFYLHGEPSLTHRLYELIFNHVCGLEVLNLQKPGAVALDCSKSLGTVGFSPDEGLLPYPNRSFLGFRLLLEYFTLPEKFLFFEVSGLERVAAGGIEEEFALYFYLDRQPSLEQALSAETFRLGAAPIVNLFEPNPTPEPIRITHSQTEYRVVADRRRPESVEVYSVDAVTSAAPDRAEAIRFEPFYAFRHSMAGEAQRTFWYATRRPSGRPGDQGTEVWLSLVDGARQPALPAVETLTVHATCTNRDLPGKLAFGGDERRFHLEGKAPVSSLVCLKLPTKAIRSHLDRRTLWRLISHLSLNYLPLSGSDGAPLREVLQLYNFAADPEVAQVNGAHIEGIRSVASRRVVRRPRLMPWNGFVRGMEVSVDFDHRRYVGSSAFLLASVLEVFLGLYASINSFSQLVATSNQGKQVIKTWPPRAGEQSLL